MSLAQGSMKFEKGGLGKFPKFATQTTRHADGGNNIGDDMGFGWAGIVGVLGKGPDLTKTCRQKMPYRCSARFSRLPEGIQLPVKYE